MTLVKFSTAPAKVFVPEYRNTFAQGTRPAVNITESEEGFDIELAAPGLQREDFHLKVEDNVLHISVDKQTEEPASGPVNYRRREFSYYRFERSFRLSEDIDTEKIKAGYVNGILRISLALKPELKPVVRTIEVA